MLLKIFNFFIRTLPFLILTLQIASQLFQNGMSKSKQFLKVVLKVKVGIYVHMSAKQIC